MDVDVSAVPRREPGMEPFEVMTSECQERMLAIVEPGRPRRGPRHLRPLGGAGRRSSGTRDRPAAPLRILDGLDGEVLADVPAASLHEDAPLYDRPRSEPADLRRAPGRRPATTLAPPDDAGADLLDLLADTSLGLVASTTTSCSSTRSRARAATPPCCASSTPPPAADTGRGLALTTDGNHRWCARRPAGRARRSIVAESVLNLACVGARPLAARQLPQLRQPRAPRGHVAAVRGDRRHGRRLPGASGLPVVGGNVSLYNESRGTDIDPTPVVGCSAWSTTSPPPPPGVRLVDGTLADGPRVRLSRGLSGSRWAWERGHRRGQLPALDLDGHATTCALVRDLVNEGLVLGVHDAADGLGAALAEMAVAGGVGAEVMPSDGVTPQAWLFAESPSRFVLAVDPAAVGEVQRRHGAAGVDGMVIGRAHGDRLVVEGVLDVPLAEVVASWRAASPRRSATAPPRVRPCPASHGARLSGQLRRWTASSSVTAASGCASLLRPCQRRT